MLTSVEYLITEVGTQTTITPAALTVSASGGTQVYDATRNGLVTLSSNKIGNDQLIITDTSALLADKNVGQGKPVTISGISLSGPDAGIYVLASTPSSRGATATPATSLLAPMCRPRS